MEENLKVSHLFILVSLHEYEFFLYRVTFLIIFFFLNLTAFHSIGLKCYDLIIEWLESTVWIMSAVMYSAYTVNFDALIRPRRIGRGKKMFKLLYNWFQKFGWQPTKILDLSSTIFTLCVCACVRLRILSKGRTCITTLKIFLKYH